jgi:hypothetical protein
MPQNLRIFLEEKVVVEVVAAIAVAVVAMKG